MVSDIKSPGIAVNTGVGSTANKGSTAGSTNGATSSTEFGDLLKTKVPTNMTDANSLNKAASQSETLKFSQHAIERMAARGISFKPEEMMKLNDAVEKAAQKGSRESLVLMGDNALIVSVKNKTVVTAMDRAAMKENVFTNIDSTVVL